MSQLREIETRLTKSGQRITNARREVIDALLTYSGHMTADDLFEKMRADGSSIGRMTVFRTLDLLAEIGVIRPIYNGSGAAISCYSKMATITIWCVRSAPKR